MSQLAIWDSKKNPRRRINLTVHSRTPSYIPGNCWKLVEAGPKPPTEGTAPDQGACFKGLALWGHFCADGSLPGSGELRAEDGAAGRASAGLTRSGRVVRCAEANVSSQG